MRSRIIFLKVMIIGVLQLNLFIPEANSLKSKRQVVKSLKDKIRQKFNVSIAQVANLDKWQSETLAVCCVNSDKRILNSILSKVVNLVQTYAQVEIVDYTIEFF